MGLRGAFLGIVTAAGSLLAQDAGATIAPTAPSQDVPVPAKEAKSGGYVVDSGTKVPLALINSVSTKHSAEGDRIYLETVFPIMVHGRIVIPPGSYVAGTVTQVKRPGRVKGRGEIYVRFDSLTLPNGVTRDFRARMSAMDGRASEEFDKAEGKVRSEGNKGGDARTIAEAAGAGASVGVIAGGASGHYGMGAGIGAAAGAAAGLVGVLVSRGPDAILAKGSTIEMVLDRPLQFAETELSTGPMQAVHIDGGGPQPSQKNNTPTRRFPF